MMKDDKPDYMDGEWHDWHGGRPPGPAEAPVLDGTPMDVELRNGDVRYLRTLSGAKSHWIHLDQDSDIIRFRVRTEDMKTYTNPISQPGISFTEHQKNLIRQVTKEKSVQLSYSVNNVMAAAKFCYENNTIYADPQDAYESIMEMMKQHAREPDATFVGTGGFMILFDEGGESLVHAEVLVSPDLAEDTMLAVYNTETL